MFWHIENTAKYVEAHDGRGFKTPGGRGLKQQSYPFFMFQSSVVQSSAIKLSSYRILCQNKRVSQDINSAESENRESRSHNSQIPSETDACPLLCSKLFSCQVPRARFNFASWKMDITVKFTSYLRMHQPQGAYAKPPIL